MESANSTVTESTTGIDIIGPRLFWVSPYQHHTDDYLPLKICSLSNGYYLTRGDTIIRQLNYFTSLKFEGAKLIPGLAAKRLDKSENKYVIPVDKSLIYIPGKIIQRAAVSPDVAHYGKNILLSTDIESGDNCFIAVLIKGSEFMVVNERGEFMPFELYTYSGRLNDILEYKCGNDIIYKRGHYYSE